MKKFIPIKLIMAFMVIMFSHSVAYANPTQRCDNAKAKEFFAPLAQLFIDNAGNPPVENLCTHLDKARIYNKINGNESEVIRQLNIVIRISTNQAPDNLSQGASDAFIAEAERLIGILGENLGLPPHPGEAGKATIEGVDSNENFLRDDLEIFIAESWPDSPRTRAMMIMGAKHMQKTLLVAHDRDLVRAHMNDNRQFLCFGYMDWTYGIDGYDELIDDLTPQLLNTWDRRDRYTLFGKQLSGMVGEGTSIPFKKAKRFCDFDPDTLSN